MTTISTVNLLNGAPYPNRDPWVDKDGFVTDEVDRWLLALVGSVQASPSRVGAQVILTEQDDSIAFTDIAAGGNLAAGVYRLTYYVRVTSPDGVASSIEVDFSFTDHGQVMTFPGAAVTGDTVTSAGTGSIMFYADGNAPITYSTIYASNTPNAMVYELIVILEQIQVETN